MQLSNDSLNAFFKRLNAKPEVIVVKTKESMKFLEKFIMVEFLDINLKLLKELLASEEECGGRGMQIAHYSFTVERSYSPNSINCLFVHSFAM